jgi:hypothetical protein
MFEEPEAEATQDELAEERAVAKTTTVRGFVANASSARRSASISHASE